MEYVKLGELVELKQGMAINSKSNYLVSEIETSLPLLRIADMPTKSKIVFMKESTPERFIANEKDIIYTRTGQVGLVFRNQYGVVHNNCFRVIPKDENIIDRQFLFWTLRLKSVYIWANNIASGAAQPDLPHNSFKSIKIPLFNIKIQKRIASILNNYDKSIENNNKRISILEQMAGEIYKEWFVRYRFPGYKDMKFENELPSNFKLMKIRDITKLKSGYAFKSDEFLEEGKVCVAKIKDINDGIMKVDDFSFITNDNTIRKANKFKLRQGDLTIALTGATIGKLGIVPKFEREIYANQRLGKFFNGDNPLEKLPYLYVLFSQDSMREMIYNVSGASAAQPNISPEQIENFKIISNKELIEKYNKECYSIFEEILKLDQINKNLIKQRDLLLPRLMSGKLEVK